MLTLIFLPGNSACNSFIRRLLMVPLDENDFFEELNTVMDIAVANGYKNSTTDWFLRTYKNKKFKPQANTYTKNLNINQLYEFHDKNGASCI